MNFIEQCKKDLLKLLPATTKSIVFEYYITFGNFYNPEWRNLTLNDLPRAKEESGLNVSIRYDDKHQTPIAKFKLLQMPGCCGICISTGVATYNDFKKLGINKLLNKFRIQIAKECGYTILMCTDLQDNIGELKTLEANDWKHLLTFTNYKTNNKLNLTIKEL